MRPRIQVLAGVCGPVDALDLRILATVGYVPWAPAAQDPDRVKPTRLAKQLDVTPETVRERLRRMEQAEVVRSWEAYPNPRHLGFRLGGWAFAPDSRDTARGALEELTLVDGVLEVFTYRGPLLSVALAYEDETQRDRRLSLLSRRLGDGDPVHVIDPPLREPEGELDRVDWQIVDALRGDARRPLSEVADEVSRSYRTVKRRFDDMTREASLFLAPRVDLSRVDGLLPFTLAIQPEDPPREVADRVDEVLGDRVLHRLVPPDPEASLLAVGAWAHTVHEMGTWEAQVEALAGVDAARAVLSAGRHATDWFDERIQARAAEA